MLCKYRENFLPRVVFKIRTGICKKSGMLPIRFMERVIQRPGIKVFKCSLRVGAFLYLLQHKFFVRVVAVKKAFRADVGRVTEHYRHAAVIGYFPQYLRRDIGIGNDPFPACGKSYQFTDFDFNTLPGHLFSPKPMLLGRHIQPFLPTAHGVKITESGLLPTGQFFPRESVVVIFAAGH